MSNIDLNNQIPASGMASLSVLNTYTKNGDQSITSKDGSAYRQGTWSDPAVLSGGIYTLLGELAMKYESHNVAIDANGNFLGRDETDPCFFVAYTESGFVKYYSAVSAAAGVVPTWVLKYSLNLLTGLVHLDGALEATGGATFASISSGTIAMNNTKITGLSPGINPTDAATVSQITSGILPQNPIVTPNVIDDTLSAPPVSPVIGEAYLVGATATGVWTGMEGRIMQYPSTGSTWIDVLGRAVIAGDRLGLTLEHGTVAGGFATKDDNIAVVVTATPGSYTYTFIAPVNGHLLTVNGVSSPDYGHQYMYNSTSVSWVETGVGGATIGGNGLTLSGNTLSIDTAITMDLATAQNVAGVKSFNDSTLKLKGSTSGASTIKAPAVAADYIATLPEKNITIAGVDDVDLKAPKISPTFKPSSDISYGEEVITTTADRDMSGANGWSGTNYAVNNGNLEYTGGGNDVATLAGYTAIIGTIYKVTMDADGGDFTISFGGVSIPNNMAFGPTTVTVYITAISTAGLSLEWQMAMGTATIDNVTVKPIILGNPVITLNSFGDVLQGEIRANNSSIGIGENALKNNITGSDNTAYGKNSLYSNITGYSNVANGSYSLYNNTAGYNNVANGSSSLYNNTEGYNNVANGISSLYNNTTGSNNVANGSSSLFNNTTGYNNVANGSSSLYSNTTGYSNVANGSYSLYNNTTGSNNVANGSYSLYNNTEGYNNVANGFFSLYSNTTGYSNVANGISSLYNNTAGSNNVALGSFAGGYETGSNTLYIDGLNRGSTALEKEGAILYGTFDVTPTNQTLKINAKLTTQGNIELGHASDTTLSRVSAGVIAVEGDKIMTVGGADTVTGLKTFDTTKLAVKGSSTGSTAIASANASATNYTATLPAKDGTIAMTSDITAGGITTADAYIANRIFL